MVPLFSNGCFPQRSLEDDFSGRTTEFVTNATLLRSNCDKPIVGLHLRRLIQRRCKVAVDGEYLSFCAPMLSPKILIYASCLVLSLSFAIRDSEVLFYFIAVPFAIVLFQLRPFHWVYPRSAVHSVEYVSRRSLFGSCEVARIRMSNCCLDVTTDEQVTF